jgi:hypothetical protein
VEHRRASCGGTCAGHRHVIYQINTTYPKASVAWLGWSGAFHLADQQHKGKIAIMTHVSLHR